MGKLFIESNAIYFPSEFKNTREATHIERSEIFVVKVFLVLLLQTSCKKRWQGSLFSQHIVQTCGNRQRVTDHWIPNPFFKLTLDDFKITSIWTSLFSTTWEKRNSNFVEKLDIFLKEKVPMSVQSLFSHIIQWTWRKRRRILHYTIITINREKQFPTNWHRKKFCFNKNFPIFFLYFYK